MKPHIAATHDALQSIVCDQERSGIEELDGAILTGWVIVGEVMYPDGQRSIVRWCGPESVTAWLRDGLLHEALYGAWHDPLDGGEGDDDEDYE